MTIALIGMSGIGKTYWAHKLNKAGFTYYGCDNLIEKKLQKELKRHTLSGLDGISARMGQAAI